MKKIIIGLCLLSTTCYAVVSSYTITAGTNSVTINKKRYPLNCISLAITDSYKCQLLLIYPQGQGMLALTPVDSAKHFNNAGVAFTNSYQLDSFYQVKFVK